MLLLLAKVAKATGNASVAIGKSAEASGFNNVAIGLNVNAKVVIM